MAIKRLRGCAAIFYFGTAIFFPSVLYAEGIETVVVTAEKRSENIQEVPGTVSVYSKSQIRDLQIRSTADLATVEPGLGYYTVDGSSFVTLRGVGVPVDTGTADNNISINVDGVNIPRATEGFFTAYDLERIEVLRGPQGTLYGRNTTGGAINYISASPTDTFTSEVGALYESYDTGTLHGFVSGPLSDDLRFRLSAAYTARDKGFVRNVYTGQSFDKLENTNVRAALSWVPAPSITVDVAAQYTVERFQAYQQVIAPFPGNAYPFGLIGDVRYLGTPVYPGTAPLVSGYDYSTKPWTIASDYNPSSRRSTLLTTSNINWDIGNGISVRSVTGYINHTFVSGVDGDATSVPIEVIPSNGPYARRQPSQSFSQELDLQGTLFQTGHWLVGSYFFNENAYFFLPVFIGSNLSPVFAINTRLQSSTKTQERSYAVFTDFTIPITNMFRLFAGGRLSWDSVETKYKDVMANPGGIFQGVPPAFNPIELECFGTPYAGTEPNFDQKYSPFNPHAGAQWDVADGVKAYAQYQEGFKDGGAGISSCGNLFRPETLDSYEAGIKSELLDGRLILNVAAYHYRYKGMQIFKIMGGLSSVENANTAIDGIDVEGHYNLTDDFRADLAGTFLHARFTKFCSDDPINPTTSLCPDGTAGYDLKGRPLQNAPPYSVNFGLQYTSEIEWGPFRSLYLRAESLFNGRTHLTAYGSPDPVQPAYMFLNAFATVYADSDSFQIRLFGRNLTNKAVIAHYYYGDDGAIIGTYLPSRTVGIEVTKGFN